jgi:hypothetical protein
MRTRSDGHVRRLSRGGNGDGEPGYPSVAARARRPIAPVAGLLLGVALLSLALVLMPAGRTNHAKAVAPMARIRVRGSRLYAGPMPWRAWGMNWGVGNRAPVIAYFDKPTSATRAVLTSELRRAHLMGVNSMRIHLELGQVLTSPTQTRSRTLSALRTLLAAAERERVYLDITGNLAWRPERVPEWYGQLSERSRWQEQVNFWTAVAHTAARSLRSSATS